MEKNTRFVKAVRKYQEKKLAATGSAKVTPAEIKKIREALAHANAPKSRTNESRAVIEYRKFKEAKTGSRVITLKERKLIAAEEKKEAATKAIRECKRACVGAKINVRRGNLVEAAELIKKAGKKLIEADQGLDGMPVADQAPAPADPNAAPAGQIPQNVIDDITTLKNTIDSLAQSVGIQSPVELGGDAAAGVPAVNGAAPTDDGTMADPNAAPAPVMESIKARIEARKARMAETKEMACVAAKAASGYICDNDNLNGVPQAKIATVDNAEQVKVPSTKELLGGTKKGPVAAAKTWPTKPITEPSQTKKVAVKESENNDSWAEKTLDKRMEQKKVNWNEILKSGLMG